MNNKKNGLFRNSLFYIVVFLLVMGVIYFFQGNNSSSQTQDIQTSEFIQKLNSNKIKRFSVQPSGGVYKISGTYRTAQKAKPSTGFTIGNTNSSTKVTKFTTSVLQNNSPFLKLRRQPIRITLK